MPFVRIASANTRQIGSGAFRPPLKRMVVHALGRQAIGTITLYLVAERTDHLAVADITALAHVNVAARQL